MDTPTDKQYPPLASGQTLGPDHHRFQLSESIGPHLFGELWLAKDLSTQPTATVTLLHCLCPLAGQRLRRPTPRLGAARLLSVWAATHSPAPPLPRLSPRASTKGPLLALEGRGTGQGHNTIPLSKLDVPASHYNKETHITSKR